MTVSRCTFSPHHHHHHPFLHRRRRSYLQTRYVEPFGCSHCKNTQCSRKHKPSAGRVGGKNKSQRAKPPCCQQTPTAKRSKQNRLHICWSKPITLWVNKRRNTSVLQQNFRKVWSTSLLPVCHFSICFHQTSPSSCADIKQPELLRRSAVFF